MSLNLFFYPDLFGLGTLVNVIEPSDTVSLVAVIWSAEIAINNVLFIELMSNGALWKQGAFNRK